jgi:hypothetical protein
MLITYECVVVCFNKLSNFEEMVDKIWDGSGSLYVEYALLEIGNFKEYNIILRG